MLKTLAVTLFIISVAALTLAVNPGIKVSLSQAGLTYAKDVGISVLKEKVATISVPDIAGSTKAPVVGTIDYTLSAIVIKGLSFPSSLAKIVAGKAIEAQISGTSAAVTMNWHYREHSWPHISGSGSADVSISDTTITLTVAFGDAGGKADVTTFSSAVSIGKLDIKVHGGPSWLYNLFIDAFKGQIKDAAEKGIVDAINKEKPLLDGVLAKLPTSADIDKQAEIDFALTSAPVIGSSFISVPMTGAWSTLVPTKATAPYTATAMPTTATTEMLEVMASPFMIDGASWVFWKEGKMSKTFTPKDVPPSSPIHLNTTDFKSYVPLLYSKYPNKAMQIVISAEAPPLTQVKTTGINVTGSLDIEALVETSATATTPAFTLQVKFDVTATVRLNETSVSLNLTHYKTDISLKKSYIGTFDPTTLDSVISFLTNGVLLPYANSYANKGFELPVIKGVKLINPKVGYGENFIFVRSSISYTP